MINEIETRRLWKVGGQAGTSSGGWRYGFEEVTVNEMLLMFSSSSFFLYTSSLRP